MICEGTKKIGNNEIDIPIGRSRNWRWTEFGGTWKLYVSILYVSKLISFKLIDNQ